MFCKKGVPQNFSNFIEKHLCWSRFSITLLALRYANLLKRDSNTGAGLKTCNFIKRDSNYIKKRFKGVFLRNLRNFWEHLFRRKIANGCFWSISVLKNFAYLLDKNLWQHPFFVIMRTIQFPLSSLLLLLFIQSISRSLWQKVSFF